MKSFHEHFWGTAYFVAMHAMIARNSTTAQTQKAATEHANAAYEAFERKIDEIEAVERKAAG